jgi:hypothetical protein
MDGASLFSYSRSDGESSALMGAALRYEVRCGQFLDLHVSHRPDVSASNASALIKIKMNSHATESNPPDT